MGLSVFEGALLFFFLSGKPKGNKWAGGGGLGRTPNRPEVKPGEGHPVEQETPGGSLSPRGWA